MGNAFFGGDMSKSRRQFLKHSSLAILGAAAGCRKPQNSGALPPGAPPAFGTAPAVGPEILPATFAEAEKLLQVELTSAERGLAARSWRTNMAALYERRTGPRMEFGGFQVTSSSWSTSYTHPIFFTHSTTSTPSTYSASDFKQSFRGGS